MAGREPVIIIRKTEVLAYHITRVTFILSCFWLTILFQTTLGFQMERDFQMKRFLAPWGGSRSCSPSEPKPRGSRYLSGLQMDGNRPLWRAGQAWHLSQVHDQHMQADLPWTFIQVAGNNSRSSKDSRNPQETSEMLSLLIICTIIV